MCDKSENRSLDKMKRDIVASVAKCGKPSEKRLHDHFWEEFGERAPESYVRYYRDLTAEAGEDCECGFDELTLQDLLDPSADGEKPPLARGKRGGRELFKGSVALQFFPLFRIEEKKRVACGNESRAGKGFSSNKMSA